ncbi:MAG: ABC transporter permease [Rhodospirillaceae bacterium]
MVSHFSSLDRKLLRDLSRIKGQGLAISAVIACGVTLLIATYDTVATLENSMDAFYDRTRFADVFAVLKRGPDELLYDIQRIPGVSRAETRITAAVNLDIPYMNEPATGQLISLPERGTNLLNAVELTTGRYPSNQRPNEVAVTDNFAKAHSLTLGNTFQAIVNGNKRKLEIVGLAMTPEYIYALGPGSLMPDDRRFGVIWMGRKALAAAFDLDGAFNDVTLSLQRGANQEEVIRRLDVILKPFGGIGSYAREDQKSHFFLTNELAQLRSSGAIFPPVFLLVAAFLLNVVVSRIVATEREQIGLLKAFGYSNLEVGAVYLKLVLILVTAGLLLGMLGGYWMGNVLVNMYQTYYKFPLLPSSVDPTVLITAALVSLGAGLAGGLGAARQAVKLPPAVAMAPPIPTSYRNSGLTKLFTSIKISQPTRMIFRHFTRFPIRSGLTIMGISFSVALMITSLFFLDSVEKVIQVYFFQAERQTLTISFVEPRPGSVEQEIQNLPGVITTQPVRTVAARLRNGHLSDRKSILGIVSGADLNRMLDNEEKVIEPPPGGIALSKHIAEDLNLNIGDLITVEVLQERQPVVQVPVVRLVEEYLGFQAYMHLDALNRLMKEGPTVSYIHVLVDSQHADELYASLKDLPAVAGIAQQTATLNSFRETLDNTMNIMIGFYVALATLIGFGVAYNAARIALSERSRALASLQVLGFTRFEVTYILLGELGILTLLSLPVGCMLGYLMAIGMSPMLKTDLYNFPFVINTSTYGWSIIVVSASAIVCGFMTRQRIYNLDLLTALKTRE